VKSRKPFGPVGTRRGSSTQDPAVPLESLPTRIFTAVKTILYHFVVEEDWAIRTFGSRVPRCYTQEAEIASAFIAKVLLLCSHFATALRVRIRSDALALRPTAVLAFPSSPASLSFLPRIKHSIPHSDGGSFCFQS